VFDLQDKVAISVAGVIEPTLQSAEIRRSSQRPTADLSAYDLFLRAEPDSQSQDRDRVMRALALLDQAIERDLRYGPALALAANCYHKIDLHSWTDDPPATRREGVRLARQALLSGADDPTVLGYAGFVLGWFGENIDTSLQLIERSLALHPSYAFGWLLSGNLSLYAGRTASAIERFETSLRLDPRSNRGIRLSHIGQAHFFDKHFEVALEKLLLALGEDSSFITTHRFLVACYAHLGRLREAREAAERLRAMNPTVWPNTVPYRNPEHRELYLSGLRLGLGEEAP
jgi:adenylate cyclase